MTTSPWQLLPTADGSHTLYNMELDESYHSKFGAITESRHVFIENGLYACLPEPAGALKILEVGFGTGLNALLTLIESHQQNIPVHYVALEAHPLGADIYNRLNYPQILQDSAAQESFLPLHDCAWEEPLALGKNFVFEKHHLSVEDFFSTGGFDLIYFDAFAPLKQPEMWDKRLLQKMYDFLNSGGILTTYCARGQFRRHLKEIGFRVESKPGPPGKREMTVAHKSVL